MERGIKTTKLRFVMAKIKLEDLELEEGNVIAGVDKTEKKASVKKPSSKKADRRKKIAKKEEVENDTSSSQVEEKASSSQVEEKEEISEPCKAKKEIHIPNNAYAGRNTKLLLNPSNDGLSYKFNVGDEEFLLSMNFNFVKRVKKSEDGTYLFYLNEKTFRNGKFVSVNGKWVLIPDKTFSTTFIDVFPPFKGSSEIISIEPAEETCEIIFVRDYKVENKTYNKYSKRIINHSTSDGKVISHSGAVYITIELKGRSIEDQRTFTVFVDRNGFSKVL